MECGCPSNGGIKNYHIRYPSYGGTQKKKKYKKVLTCFSSSVVYWRKSNLCVRNALIKEHAVLDTVHVFSTTNPKTSCSSPLLFGGSVLSIRIIISLHFCDYKQFVYLCILYALLSQLLEFIPRGNKHHSFQKNVNCNTNMLLRLPSCMLVTFVQVFHRKMYISTAVVSNITFL